VNYHKIYTDVFADSSYSRHPTDEYRYVAALNFIQDKYVHTHIDISCGRGVFIQAFRERYPDKEISCTDINNFHNLDGITFHKLDLSSPNDLQLFAENYYDCATCLDVMEHLEEEYVDYFLWMLAKSVKYAFFTIAHTSEVRNEIELHVNGQNKQYWEEKLGSYFRVLEHSYYFGENLSLFGVVKQ
jgi:hypothetical protein